MSIASRKVVNCDLPWISHDHVGMELENRVTCMLLEEVVRCNVGAALMVRLSSEGTYSTSHVVKTLSSFTNAS